MVDQHADSCFVKLSNCGSASESDIKSFLQGIDIEVNINHFSNNFYRHVEPTTLEVCSSSALVLKVLKQLWPSTKKN